MNISQTTLQRTTKPCARINFFKYYIRSITSFVLVTLQRLKVTFKISVLQTTCRACCMQKVACKSSFMWFNIEKNLQIVVFSWQQRHSTCITIKVSQINVKLFCKGLSFTEVEYWDYKSWSHLCYHNFNVTSWKSYNFHSFEIVLYKLYLFRKFI